MAVSRSADVARELLKRHRLVSNQVSEAEVAILLRELDMTLSRTTAGDVVEFGCYVGTSSLFISRLLNMHKTPRVLHVYDSFAGLPEKTASDISPAGEQFQAGELYASKKQFIDNYKKAGLPLPYIHKGWFNELTNADIPEAIAFAFLDGDYYDSIRTPLELIWPRLVPGAIVIVDDYASDALPGAAKAVDEWLQTHPARLSIEQSLALVSV